MTAKLLRDGRVENVTGLQLKTNGVGAKRGKTGDDDAAWID